MVSALEFNIQFAQFVYTTFMLTIGMVSLIVFQWKIYKSQVELSTQLRIHLFIWILFLGCSLSYYGPLIVLFCQEGK